MPAIMLYTKGLLVLSGIPIEVVCGVNEPNPVLGGVLLASGFVGGAEVGVDL